MFSGARHIAKLGATAILASSPMLSARLGRIERAGALTILNFHRVDDRHLSSYSAIAPRHFDELVGWLKSRFRIVTFRDLGELVPHGKPPLILSFDDGYRDFVDVVAPILERYGVAANQNVIPSSIETGRPPLNVILQDFIGQAPASLLKEITITGLSSPLDPDDRSASGLSASAALKSRPIGEQKDIIAGLEAAFRKFDAFSTVPMLTLDHVRQVAGIHEIGAHSFEHATMEAETADYLRADAARCRDWFRRYLASEPEVYAFPNGSARPGQSEIVRDSGYQTVLLVGERFSRPQGWLHPRFTMYGDSAGELRFRALGALVGPGGSA